MLPLPVSASVPPLIVVAPLYVWLPVSVCVPAFSVIPPVPPIEPAYVPAAFVRVSVREPRVVTPAPVRAWTEAPAVAPEISNVPLLMTPLEAARLPLPASARVEPLPMAVAPV